MSGVEFKVGDRVRFVNSDGRWSGVVTQVGTWVCVKDERCPSGHRARLCAPREITRVPALEQLAEAADG